MIKGLILDLDDTIFPTNSIDPLIFKPFFDSFEKFNDVLSEAEIKKASAELWKRPFQVVAETFGFSDNMINKSLECLNTLDFSLSIKPFEDYSYLKTITLNKYLVTTGFKKLQLAKIEALSLGNDFMEIIIDDPTVSSGGKVEAFKAIMRKYNHQPEEILVIGDNLDSEIKAGIELGMQTLLIDRKSELPIAGAVINSFHEIRNIIGR